MGPRSRPRTQRINHNAIPVLPRSNAIAAAARVFPVFSKTRYRSADVIVACRSRKSSAALVRRKTLGGDTVPRLGLWPGFRQATRLRRSRRILIAHTTKACVAFARPEWGHEFLSPPREF